MPGIYGCLTSKTDFSNLGIIKFEKSEKREMFYEDDFIQLGIHERAYQPSAFSFYKNGNDIVSLYGHCFDSKSRLQIDAKTFAQEWVTDKNSLLDRLEGAFHFVIWSIRQKHLTIGNDRIGILPLYWHQDSDIFSFAPRMRLLMRQGKTWDPAPGSIISFLSVGHFLGSSTQTQQAKFLTPATILSINLTTLKVEENRYWNLVYSPDRSLSSNEYRQQLGEAIIDSVDLFTKPSGGRHGIFLSGGWDSRSILGATLKLNQPPCLVISNGVSDEIPMSDTWLAKKMAKDLNIPYRFCRRIPDAGQKLWLDGVHRGEITTANNPESFGQHRLSPDMFSELDFILKGDVTWGSGDLAPTRQLSIGKIVPYPLMDKIKAVLNPDLATEADQLYESEIDGVMNHCENNDWTDRRDYLWQMGGINRYILGLGISDEEHIQVRRPLLSGRVLDVYTKVPQKYRILKNLFIETIKKDYPHLFNYGRNHASNIANYYAYMAPYVRERTLYHINSGHDLGGILNLDKCKIIIENFKPSHSENHSPNYKSIIYNKIHDRYSYNWHRTKFYREKNIKKFETSDTMLAFHLYLLLEWFYGSENSILKVSQ